MADMTEEKEGAGKVVTSLFPAPSPSRKDLYHPRTSHRSWRPSWLTWTIVILALGTLVAGFYPSAAGWISSYNQAQVIDGYLNEVEEVEPDAATQIALAHEYNEALTYGVIVEAGTNIPVGHAEPGEQKLDYSQMLKSNADGIMGRIRIPSIDVDLPIYHGTSDEVLLKGAGHLQGSHLPVGGAGTRTVITAHRGLANAVMFTNLDKVEVGDTFTLEVLGEVLVYRVSEIRVIQPEDTDTLRPEQGRDLATLITCTPLGLNTHRIVVTGERVIPTPQEDRDNAGMASDLPHFPWWLVGMGGGVAASGAYLYFQGKRDAARTAWQRTEATKLVDVAH